MTENSELFLTTLESPHTEFSSVASNKDVSDEDELIENVLISPGNMIFNNAYDGKTFDRKLVFQNRGPNPAFIRLCQSSSSAIKYKPFPAGYTLSSGLKIVRSVTFKYKKEMPITGAHCFIYINEVQYEFHFVVNKSRAIISFEPSCLDFGRIDASCGDTVRKLVVKNTGFKGAQFNIDLGRNDLNLIVEPMKGQIPAQSSVTISVELIGWKEGSFEREFWIKTTPPQRVLITGQVVAPQLIVRKSVSRLKMVLLDFKRIYYGSRATKTLIIKNSSPSPAMFCVMAQIKDSTMTLSRAREIDENYRNFIIEPEDGRWAAEKGTVIRITYNPSNKHELRNYKICFLRVIRLDCHDLDIDITRKKRPFYDSMSVCESYLSNATSCSVSFISLSQIYIGEEEDTSEDSIANSVTDERSIMVCIHGESEEAQIYIRPDLIVITDMVLNTTYQRELFIQNQSYHLPIKLKFFKIPFVDVVPNVFNLNRRQSIEVKVIIRASKLDYVSTYIAFELYCMDKPAEFGEMRKIGINKIKLEFTTNQVIKKPKLKQCCLNKEETFINWDHHFEADRLPSNEVLKKNNNRKYYNRYIKGYSKSDLKLTKNPSIEDYDLTDQKKLLQMYWKCQSCKKIPKDPKINMDLMPLQPKHLYNIKIYPKTINLKRMAPFTSATSSFTIQNQNKFPINIYLIASKSYLTFENGHRGTIGAGQSKNFSILFTSSLVGKFPARIDVIVNTSAVFKITVMVRVMAKYLRLEPSTLEFRDNEPNTQFITIINGLNSDTSFDWELSNEFYTIQPMEGGVPAGRSIICMVSLLPLPNIAKHTESILTAESGQKRILETIYHKRQQQITFTSQDIDFGIVPFNETVKKRIGIKNCKNNPVFFSIPDANPIPGVYVTPHSDYLLGKDCKVLTVTIKMRAIVAFVTKFTVIVDEEIDFTINVKGQVDVPLIKLEPDIIVFRKISPYAFDRAVFQITNRSKFDLRIRFPFEDISEFTITTRQSHHLPHVNELVLCSQETKLCYLNFYPKYATTYTIFLPYIINSIIGPVSNGSSSMSIFLNRNEEAYKNFPECKIIYPRKTLPYIRMNCCSVLKMIQFNNRYIHFLYYGEGHSRNMTCADFEVINIMNEPVRFCIRYDNLTDPFSIEPNCDLEWKEFPNSYEVYLNENEKFTFRVEFIARDMGHYACKLPIFVKGHIDDKVFNFLSLEGDYEMPTMIPTRTFLYFEPIIPLLKNQIVIHLEMRYHFPECHVNVETDLMEMEIEYERCEESDYMMPVTFTCISASPICYDSKITFECSCNSSCEVIVKGVVDNTMLFSNWYANTLKTSPLLQETFANKDDTKLATTSLSSVTGPTFHTVFINHNTTCFPYFPHNPCDSEYGKYMNGVVNNLENWIYCQVFNCDSYYRIPESFIYEFHQCLKRGAAPPDLPLVTFLMKVISPSIRKCCIDRPYEGDYESHYYMEYIIEIYIKILNYFLNFPIYVPQIKPKYLLNYEQYVQYQKLKLKKNIMSRSRFYHYSKQCWVDLILQIIKVFIINRNPLPQTELSSYWDDTTNTEFGICSQQEQHHLDWLIKTYEENKYEYPISSKKLETIIKMDENLHDSIILGIVTATYCPYVKHLIDQMFFPPRSHDQYFHNACLLIKSWNLLNLSYKINPNGIITLDYLQTILLTVYLHEVLPTCTPTECLTITAPLSQSAHANIELENLGHEIIIYQAIFFQNENNLFSIKESLIKIAPGKKRVVSINYKAKYVCGQTSYLLFSGETPGHKYGKSLCARLEGVPDLTAGLVINADVTVELYKNVLVGMQVKSPHGCEAKYKLYSFYSDSTDEKISHKLLMPANKLYTSQLINETAHLDPEPPFDKDGIRNFHIKSCCLQPNPRCFYIFYLNEELGDFGIKITASGKLTQKHHEVINIALPKHYEQNICICKGKPNVTRNCPRIVQVEIPAKNELLWNGIKSIILRDVDDTEKQFWNKIIYTTLGTRIIVLVLQSQISPFVGIKLDEPVEYNVVVDGGKHIKTVNKLVIKDVVAENTVSIPVHPTTEIKGQMETFLRLNAIDGREKRLYKLIFREDTSSQIH